MKYYHTTLYDSRCAFLFFIFLSGFVKHYHITLYDSGYGFLFFCSLMFFERICKILSYNLI